VDAAVLGADTVQGAETAQGTPQTLLSYALPQSSECARDAVEYQYTVLTRDRVNGDSEACRSAVKKDEAQLNNYGVEAAERAYPSYLS
jgi:hypothetical protein